MKFNNESDHLTPQAMDWTLVGDSTVEDGVSAGYPEAIAEQLRRRPS